MNNFSLKQVHCKRTSCVGGRHMFFAIDIIEYGKMNLKTNGIVKLIRGNWGFHGRSKSQSFSEKWIKGQDFERRAKWKHGYCSSLSNQAWCDSKSKRDVLKLHDKCPNCESNCQNK